MPPMPRLGESGGHHHNQESHALGRAFHALKQKAGVGLEKMSAAMKRVKDAIDSVRGHSRAEIALAVSMLMTSAASVSAQDSGKPKLFDAPDNLRPLQTANDDPPNPDAEPLANGKVAPGKTIVIDPALEALLDQKPYQPPVQYIPAPANPSVLPVPEVDVDRPDPPPEPVDPESLLSVLTSGEIIVDVQSADQLNRVSAIQQTAGEAKGDGIEWVNSLRLTQLNSSFVDTTVLNDGVLIATIAVTENGRTFYLYDRNGKQLKEMHLKNDEDVDIHQASGGRVILRDGDKSHIIDVSLDTPNIDTVDQPIVGLQGDVAMLASQTKGGPVQLVLADASGVNDATEETKFDNRIVLDGVFETAPVQMNLAPNGRTMIAVFPGGDVKEWNIDTGKQLRVPVAFKTMQQHLVTAADGRVAFVADDGTVCTYSNAGFQDANIPLDVASGNQEVIGASEDGVFVTSTKTGARAYDVTVHGLGGYEASFTTTEPPLEAKVSDTGSITLVTGSQDPVGVVDVADLQLTFDKGHGIEQAAMKRIGAQMLQDDHSLAPSELPKEPEVDLTVPRNETLPWREASPAN